MELPEERQNHYLSLLYLSLHYLNCEFYLEFSSRKFVNMAFGDYPVEYNPKIHGIYDPARFYGKPDTPFGQVKVAEIGSWLARRDKSPRAFMGALSRGFWRWQHKYCQAKRVGATPVFQVLVASMIFFYTVNYGKIKLHRNYKYH